MDNRYELWEEGKETDILVESGNDIRELIAYHMDECSNSVSNFHIFDALTNRIVWRSE